jgi:serine/threonine-protein kinase
MNRVSSKISTFHSEIIQQTHIGQLCGQGQLFHNRYEILRILGRGGFGITFLAKDATLPGNPLCVIKQLCPKVTNPRSLERARERFEKEAKILGQLGSHSQIPMLLDYFEVNGEFYLVQEYIRGSTIAREIRRHGRKDEAAVKQFLVEILPVLNYVHKNRVIHRDIKPQNLLRCDEDKRLVLIDFGAVKEELIATGEVSTKTNSTNFVGTMGFAPPEQFTLRSVYSSDIYALGVTCIYMLTAKAPLEFEYDHDTGEIAWQREVEVSEHFAQVLNKMLKMSLEERFKKADDVMWNLGMERHLPTLTKCLNTEKLSNDNTSSSNSISYTNSSVEGATSNGYISPTAREAIAIREWREKLNSKKRHH